MFPGMLRAAGRWIWEPGRHQPGICRRGGHSALLPLSVLDVNDETPTFFPSIYNVSLPENVARDFRVVRLNCTDADIGLNAELSYFITGMKCCVGDCGKSTRMGLTLLRSAFRAGSLSGDLEHLVARCAGGFGRAGSGQTVPSLLHSCSTCSERSGNPLATLCLADCTCRVQPSGNRLKIQVSPESFFS